MLVFDASALLAYLKDEPGGSTAESLLIEPRQSRVVHAVNLCEVYYHFLQREDERRAEMAVADIEGTGLLAREDVDRDFWRFVARAKSDIPHASLGDCFAIALAARLGGTIVTADHPGFETAEALGLCPVTFIR